MCTDGPEARTRHTHLLMYVYLGKPFYFIFFNILIGVQLLYNVVFVSAVEQSESAISISTSPLFWISFPFRSPQSTEQSSLYYTVGSHQLSILYIVVYICQSQTLSSSHHPPPPWYPKVCSLYFCLYFCFANKFICITFLHSTYKQYYTIFVFLFLTHFTLDDSFQVRPHLCIWHNFVPFNG